MTTIWQCGVCETVNSGGRLCRACGSELSRSATILRSAQGMRAPALPPARPAEPLPAPVERAVNREPVDEEEWADYDAGNKLTIIPTPFGCFVSSVPRRPPTW